MSQKRHQEDGKAQSEGNTSEDKRQKVPSLKNVVLDVMRLHSVQHFVEPVLEPLIRKVVREEVELALRKYLTNMTWNCGKEIYSSESRSLQLHFCKNPSLPVFTGTRIEGEDCTTLKVALYDDVAQQVVTSGPESSAKVEIVVLEGDFDSEDGGNWTLEEFKNNIVKEREGKKPLLSGEASLILKEGIGLVGDISFTDNSSWTRSRKFRLGARVVDSCEGIRIREAKTESFIVRDHRGELYKKHHPPNLSDEVWRLEKIGKDGAFHKRLSRERVNSVKDFLQLFHLDPARLRNILGTGMSAKMWDITVDHAQTCVLDKKLYLCRRPGSEEKTGVVFNEVGQVMGLLSESQYVPIDKMSETEKNDAQHLVISAFQQEEDVVPIEDEASLLDGSVRLNDVLNLSTSTTSASPSGNKVLAFHKNSRLSHLQPSVASPDVMQSIYSVAGVSGLDDFGLFNIDSMDLRIDQTLSLPGDISDSLFCGTDSIAQPFGEDEHLQYFDVDAALQSQDSNWGSHPTDSQSADNGYLLPSSAQLANDQAQRRWRKISMVLRLFSVRRIVAKKNHVKELKRYRQ